LPGVKAIVFRNLIKLIAITHPSSVNIPDNEAHYFPGILETADPTSPQFNHIGMSKNCTSLALTACSFSPRQAPGCVELLHDITFQVSFITFAGFGPRKFSLKFALFTPVTRRRHIR
jgi:hypothetical protein